ncbi:MAG: hypothetical protein QXJ74_10940 [Nitrososphaera sp.]
MTLPDYIRPKVAVKKWDGTETFFSYDSFAPPSSGPRLLALEVEDREMQPGLFTVHIEDSGRLLDARVGNGNKVVIQLGHTQGSLSNYMAGFVRQVDVLRSATGLYEVKLHGWSSVVRLEERIGNFYRIADRAQNGEDPDLSDEKMKCSEVFKDLFEDSDHLPIGQPAEAFSTAGVQDIQERVASIKEPFVEWKQVADRLAEASGAIYGIDANDSAFMRYPTLAHSGVTISDAGGQQDNVGYFVGPWNFRDSIKKSDGFANRLYGRGGTQLHLDADSFVDNAAIECYSADRAAQFVPSLIRVNTISLLLSRVGTLAQDIQGQVVLDDGGPEGDVVGTFTIFRSLVGTSATAVNRINVNIAGGGRIQVDKKHWIVLKRQGDSSNYFRWHHDGGASGVNAYKNESWTVQQNSYSLAHRTYSSSRVLVECSSPVSIGKYGVVEAVVDAPWIIERQAMDQYLTGILQYSALQRRLYDVKEVWAPATLLKAGTLVRLKDGKSGVDADAEVLLARYRFSAGENGLGTRKAEVQLQTFVV